MKSIAPSSLIYSYVMNNYWHTNYKADQEGPATFRYSVLPHAVFTALDAAKFGAEQRQPLLVAAADPLTQPHRSLMRLSSPDVLVSSLKPMAAGHSWLVYLYNPTSKAQKVSFQGNGGVPELSRSSDADGGAGDDAGDFEVAAFGSAYRRVDEPVPQP
jgi:alpha-mannosidase